MSPWIGTIAGLADSALRLAGMGRDTLARGAAPTPEQLRLMAAAGESLRDIREVAGMTANELSKALDLRDKGVWQAIEDGREVLSMELILRLASLLARNDPLPFVLRMTRTYQPRLWTVMEQLGVEGIPLQLEREREFINILRRHDAARALSDEAWARLLDFSRHAFELGLAMITEEKPPAGLAPRRKRRSPR